MSNALPRQLVAGLEEVEHQDVVQQALARRQALEPGCQAQVGRQLADRQAGAAAGCAALRPLVLHSAGSVSLASKAHLPSARLAPPLGMLQ